MKQIYNFKILGILFVFISISVCAQISEIDDIINERSDSSKVINFDLIKRVDSNEYFSIIDTNISIYELPDGFKKTDNWIKTELQRELYGAEFSDTLDLNDILNIIDTCEQFHEVIIAKSWCLKNYKIAFPHLVSRLSIKEKIGLKITADLIIPCRMKTGDLEFYGHGGVIGEDLFTVAGRASWILNEITGEKFVSVQCDMTKAESEKYKSLWLKYIGELTK